MVNMINQQVKIACSRNKTISFTETNVLAKREILKDN